MKELGKEYYPLLVENKNWGISNNEISSLAK